MEKRNEKLYAYLEYFKKSVSYMNGRIGLPALVSFREGIIEDQEGYKKTLAKKGQDILKFNTWEASLIGRGTITNAVKAAMRMTDGNKPHNLVDYRDKDLFDEFVNENVEEADRVFYEIYCGNNEQLAFKQAVDFFGEKYPIISFLFYLKDCSRFLPARPRKFTEKFLAIGLDPDCLKKCSWDNYARYLAEFEDIQLILMDEFKDADITLLDAHSFVWMSWMLEKNEKELDSIARIAMINYTFQDTQDNYVRVARLIDYMYKNQKFSGAHRDILNESELVKLRKDFIAKYSPEKIEKWMDYEIITKFYDLDQSSDSLIRCLSINETYKSFGSAMHTTNNIYPLYYTKDNGWCTSKHKNLSSGKLIEEGKRFRNKFVECMKHVDKMPLVTVKNYEELGEYLKKQLGEQGERVWIHKYLHMLYPDKFSEFHSVEWKKYLLCALQIKPKESFYGMVGQIAQIQQRVEIKDSYYFSQLIYTRFPEIDKGGICRLTFKPGREKQVKDWIAGERVTLTAADFEGKIRSSQWFYGASEKRGDYLFVVENSDGELMGVATSLSGEPEKGKRFDARSGIWHPCFSPGSFLPIEKDSDSNSTIRKVENILFIYKHYYSFYNISAPLLEIYKNEKEAYDQDSKAYDTIRNNFLTAYPAKINVLKKMSYEKYDIKIKGSLLYTVINEFCLYKNIGRLDAQNLELDDFEDRYNDYIGNICFLIAEDFKDFEAVENNSLNKLLKLKILSIYYPDMYIGITDESLLDSWLDMLQIHIDKGHTIWDKQSALLSWKKRYAISDRKEISNYSFIRLLYVWSGQDIDTDSEDDYPSGNASYEEEKDKEKLIKPIDDDNQIAIDNKSYDDEYENEINTSSLNDDIPEYKYEGIVPKAKEIDETAKGSTTPKYKRERKVAINALAHAHYKCECDPNHFTFIRKNSDKPYTEPHHLIPMQYSEQFKYSLDTEVNIVSLCSNCHNMIHYGKGADELIKKLYRDRAEYLKLAGIDISEENLLELYGYESGDDI